MIYKIEIKRLDSGYLRAQGNGPCEWAQWPERELLRDVHFFPEASEKFRFELRKSLDAFWVEDVSSQLND